MNYDNEPKYPMIELSLAVLATGILSGVVYYLLYLA